MLWVSCACALKMYVWCVLVDTLPRLLQDLLQTLLVPYQSGTVLSPCVHANLSWWSFLPALQCHAVCPVPDASLLVLPHCQAAHQGMLRWWEAVPALLTVRRSIASIRMYVHTYVQPRQCIYLGMQLQGEYAPWDPFLRLWTDPHC